MTQAQAESAKVHAITCTACGAPINLFGGHKVQSIVCGSCGACLDAKEEYQVIEQFIRMKRPNLPIKLGMTGKIKGVEFTVIGIVRWMEQDEDGTYQSYDMQLFSPTHGYAWLRREDLHYLFVHEVKDLPDRNVRIVAAKGSKINARGQTFSVIESGVEKVNFVEGELTSVVKLGDQSRYMTCANPPYLYEISESDGELEYAFGEYMEAEEVYKAFDIRQKPPKPLGIHCCQIYEPNIFARMAFHSLWFAIFSLIITIAIIALGRGKTVLYEKIPSSSYAKGVESKPFTIKNAKGLVAIDMNCDFDNAWGYFDVSVKQGDQEYFTLSKEIAYYHGYEGGESWTEGTQSASAYFRVPKPGKYELFVWGEGGIGNNDKRLQKKPLRIIIKEGVIVSRYFIIATFILILIAALGIWHRVRYEMERRGIELSSD